MSLSSEHIVELFMNFAAIMVIAQLDDTLGDWWKTNLTPLKGAFTFDLSARSGFAATLFYTNIAKYVSWVFFVTITGVFVFSYCWTKDHISSIKSI